MVVLCDDTGKRCAYGSPVDLRQDRVEGRALPVSGDENGNIVLIGPRMPGTKHLARLLTSSFPRFSPALLQSVKGLSRLA
jgi:hypothetical protein